MQTFNSDELHSTHTSKSLRNWPGQIFFLKEANDNLPQSQHNRRESSLSVSSEYLAKDVVDILGGSTDRGRGT